MEYTLVKKKCIFSLFLQGYCVSGLQMFIEKKIEQRISH